MGGSEKRADLVELSGVGEVVDLMVRAAMIFYTAGSGRFITLSPLAGCFLLAAYLLFPDSGSSLLWDFICIRLPSTDLHQPFGLEILSALRRFSKEI